MYVAVNNQKMQQYDKPRNVSRGIVEKHRREEMKYLYATLGSLLPVPTTSDSDPKEKLTASAMLDQSFDYVNYLKERIDKLKAKKEELQAENSLTAKSLVQPAIVLKEMDSILEVNLVSGLNKGFMLPKMINILEQEGAEILSANYSALSERIFYSVTSQAFSSRIGIETSRVQERLKALFGA